MTDKDFEALEDYRISELTIESLGPLFCEFVNAPDGAFISLSDYNGDAMLFCPLMFPLPDRYVSIRSMTESIYEDRLRDFFFILLPDNKKVQEIKIEICEQYIKD